MNRHNIHLGLVLLLLAAVTVRAQIPSPPKSVLTPNAAGLGQYGDFPVSLFTGTVQVEIPIYTLECFGYSLPISLSYHASGIRPDQHPGWVGLGWTLNAGGAIIRKVRGEPDENDHHTAFRGYCHVAPTLGASDWDTYGFVNRLLDGQYTRDLDYEPDEFSFQVGDLQGTFFFGEDSTWHVRCSSDVKVETAGYFNTNHPLSQYVVDSEFPINTKDVYPLAFMTFVLTAADGIKYTFGGTNSSVEFSTDFWKQGWGAPWTATAWMLTSITLPTGQAITLDYGRESPVAEMYLSASGGDATGDATGIYSEMFCAQHTQGALLSPVYLESIKSAGTEIIFSRGPSSQLGYDKELFKNYCRYNIGLNKYPYLPYLYKSSQGINNFAFLDTMTWHQLNSISVRDADQGRSVLEAWMTYSSVGRLTLNSLKAGPKRYRFEYNSPADLPPYLSNRTDHWGYYTNAHITPAARTNPSDQFVTYLPNKEADADSMALGMLTKVEYPTGGYTRFEYEPHTFSMIHDRGSIIQQSGMAGGLRLRRIINSDDGTASGEVTVHEYFYNDTIPAGSGSGYTSSGVLRYLPRYSYTVNLHEVSTNTAHVAYMYVYQSVAPSNSDYARRHIGYTFVIDRLPDGSYTRYQYRNFDAGGGSFLDTSQAYNYQYPNMELTAPVGDREQDRGLLMSEAAFKASGRLVTHTRYSYAPDNPNATVRAIYTKSYSEFFRQLYPGNTYYLVLYDADCYLIYTHTNRLVRKTVREYETGGMTQVSNTYNYNGHRLLSSEVCSMPCMTTTTAYTYASDRTDEASVSMARRHILSPVIDIASSVTYSDGHSDPGIRRHVVYGTAYVTSGATPDTVFAPLRVTLGKGSSLTLPEVYYEAYDKAGNVLSMRTQTGDHTVFVWGYRRRCLVATVSGATLQQVASVLGDLDTFGSQAVPNFTALESLRTALPSAHVTLWRHDPLIGPLETTDPAGRKTYYGYDRYGRLESVQNHEHNLLQHYFYHYKN